MQKICRMVRHTSTPILIVLLLLAFHCALHCNVKNLRTAKKYHALEANVDWPCWLTGATDTSRWRQGRRETQVEEGGVKANRFASPSDKCNFRSDLRRAAVQFPSCADADCVHSDRTSALIVLDALRLAFPISFSPGSAACVLETVVL
ncbi:hypothetical protein DFH11DRAFT_1746890 [Phellopilus nigrolimitatus]|nr:hypothetical protein DFH11DRAFT_1746890 [Phellopilus nigrolimitatus]